MKVEILHALVFSAPGRFKIATSDTRFSHHCVAGLSVGGVSGWGSGVLYGKRPLETAALLRQEIFPFLEGLAFDRLEAARAALRARFLERDPAAIFALDSALWDIQGKMAGLPLCRLFGAALPVVQRERIPITEQVFLVSEATLERELDAILAHGTCQVKVKIGIDPRRDLVRLEKVRARVGERVQLGVDANGGYTFEQAAWAGKEMRALGVTLIEDPLPVRDWARIPALRAATGLPVMLDAGIQNLDDLQNALRLGAADLLNLKLTRVGGLTNALALAQACRAAQVGLSVGCAEDLGLGMAAILQLSAALPELHSTEGVGAYRLGFDIVSADMLLADGSLALPAGPGLGVTFDPTRLAEAARRLGFQVGEVRSPSPGFQFSAQVGKWVQRGYTLGFRLGRRLGRER